MNVLITGGLGYVGGRLAQHLSAESGVSVWLADLPGKDPLPVWANGFKFLPFDVRDKLSVSGLFSGEKPDVVVHLAAINDADCAKNPEMAMEINTKGTYNVLQAASENGVDRFIYFSTFHVYGPAAGSEISEATPAMPVHPYSITHRAAEDYVNYFRFYKGMKTLIFRMSNSFGYPMDIGVNSWMLIFNDLCRQIMTAGHLTLKSSGVQHRDFIPLSDTVRAVSHFLLQAPDKWRDGLFNLGSGTSMSILEAARRVESVYEKKYGRKPGPMVKGEDKKDSIPPSPIRFDIQKLKSCGFVLKGGMDEEIDRTLQICSGF